tara:strand:+ start:904 stop:1974 length:1071 start_codon:yes stop_codon:yes gene_type:complete
MINSVRNTVLAIANKNNYGYISPQDFNLYAKQAQMDMFEDYFYQYNNWINRENARSSGTGYADIVKGLEEVIDSFSMQTFLAQLSPLSVPNVPSGLSGSAVYQLPSDYYLINKLYRYPTRRASGTTSSSIASTTLLIDNTVDFFTLGVQPGDIVINTSATGAAPYPATGAPGLQGWVQNIDNTAAPAGSIITCSATLFVDPAGLGGETYAIYDANNIVEVERVSQRKIFNLTSSNLTYPTPQYPCYVLDGNLISVYPTTWDGLNDPYTIGDGMGPCDVKAQYIRYPFDPNWTFATLLGGEPLFDQSQSDYQDFELPLSDEPALVAKICQYVGIEIREAEVVQFGQTEEQVDTQETS